MKHGDIYDTKEQHLELAHFYWKEARKQCWTPIGYRIQAIRHFLRSLGLPESWCFPSEEQLRKRRQKAEDKKRRQQQRRS